MLYCRYFNWGVVDSGNILSAYNQSFLVLTCLVQRICNICHYFTHYQFKNRFTSTANTLPNYILSLEEYCTVRLKDVYLAVGLLTLKGYVTEMSYVKTWRNSPVP